uniref:Putative retroelement pol polyprotein n=1 Tax=Arabidopsis thaliana TaxID=3702 RepID=Q9SJC3_ARATH|nr:putative retroelement pol polyprotein [Arabidopsis thaliana]
MENMRQNLFSNGSTHTAIPPSASQGMMLYFINMERYLTEDPPTVPQGTTNVYAVGSMNTWAQGDYCCKGLILNRLVHDRFGLYNKSKSSKTLWLALENKYKTDESGRQRFSTTKFLNFKMVDSKQIME